MTNYIYVITHGYFGKELVASAEMIVGKMENVKTFSLEVGMSVETLISKVNEEMKNDEGKKLFLVDLYGGTPFHASAYMLKNEDIDLLTGVSLPLLLGSYNGHIMNGELDIQQLVSDSSDFVQHIDKIN